LLAKSFELKQRYHWNSHLAVSEKEVAAMQNKHMADEKAY